MCFFFFFSLIIVNKRSGISQNNVQVCSRPSATLLRYHVIKKHKFLKPFQDICQEFSVFTCSSCSCSFRYVHCSLVVSFSTFPLHSNLHHFRHRHHTQDSRSKSCLLSFCGWRFSMMFCRSQGSSPSAMHIY